MNFLAHLYLTKDQEEEVVLGNFMADAIKGKQELSKYSKNIQLGMRIHREIDHFMDTHPIVQEGCKRLYANYGKFAGIIIDIYYDHILASHWSEYSSISLNDFAQQQYNLLKQFYHLLPQSTAYWYDFMVKENILLAYASEEGIKEVFAGMDRRTKYLSGMTTALNELILHKAAYMQEFRLFFEEIRAHLDIKIPQFKNAKTNDL